MRVIGDSGSEPALPRDATNRCQVGIAGTEADIGLREPALSRLELRLLQAEALGQLGLAVVVEHPVGDVVAEHRPELEGLGRAAPGEPDVVEVGVGVDDEVPVDAALVVAGPGPVCGRWCGSTCSRCPRFGWRSGNPAALSGDSSIPVTRRSNLVGGSPTPEPSPLGLRSWPGNRRLRLRRPPNRPGRESAPFNDADSRLCRPSSGPRRSTTRRPPGSCCEDVRFVLVERPPRRAVRP